MKELGTKEDFGDVRIILSVGLLGIVTQAILNNDQVQLVSKNADMNGFMMLARNAIFFCVLFYTHTIKYHGR